MPTYEGRLDAKGLRIALLASRFNETITKSLLEGALSALRRHGLDSLAESHLGRRQNRHQPLRALGEMAYAVLAAVERRIGQRASAIGGHYLRPWDDFVVAQIAVAERPALMTLAADARRAA